MYAIVRSGGKQHRVAVGDVITVDRLVAPPGDTVLLPAVLHVDGQAVTSAPDALSRVRVSAEVVGAAKGPKIDILRYKNKTGYRRRQGHRAKLTTLRVTGIDSGAVAETDAQPSQPGQER
ncbi:MAG: 50S ribosomal protein L21 [Frankiaceae bacterium]